MDSKSLLNFFAAQNAEIDILWFVIHFLLTALLSFLLAKAYVKFGNTLSNRVMFGKNFMILSMTTMLIITIVKSSVALSLGLVGALSIIRFRAAIKEPEELSYLFFAIAIGLGMGSQQAVITLVAFAVIALILWLRNMTRSDKVIPNLYLTIMGDISEGQDMMGSINQVLASQGSDFRLKRLDEKKDSFEFSYQIQFPDIASIQACRQALRALDPDLKISLIDDRGIGG
ncbi:MAG: DUF4956 domain-containing protein [Limisphaerales bacterium]|jgi:hypothetical protein|nr:DUF4956 domain-containing protein [Verrucomicrobiota bacterium]